jgi:hypothetical protein
MGKMMVQNESAHLADVVYLTRSFVEFLEILGRIAEMRKKKREMLPQAIEKLLDDFLPTFGLKKNNVKVISVEKGDSN